MIDQNYQGQTVLITGAASGIGLAQMETYLNAGAEVIALDVQPILVQHDRLHTWQLDLGDALGLQKWIEAQQPILDTIDIFLSTAGILDAFRPALATNLHEIQQFMQVNVYAAVQLTLAILPEMVERRAGEIVYMASIAGQIAGGGGSAYTTSKHALVGWMKQLALDYAAFGIHINAIAPGAIDTPMNAADFAGDGTMAKQVAQATPVKRWAQATEVADLTLYLTSAASRYVQGQVFTIDGGWTIK